VSESPETTPRRIQRKRTKGWRMPDGAVYVGRPTVYGNPFPIEGEWITGAARAFGYPTGPTFLRGAAVALYRWWLTGQEPVQGLEGTTGYRVSLTEGHNGGGAWLEGTGVIDLPKRPDLAPLRGRDLACWCPVGGWSGDIYSTGALLLPCHADVLLEIATRV
jgi:hypothetical protein